MERVRELEWFRVSEEEALFLKEINRSCGSAFEVKGAFARSLGFTGIVGLKTRILEILPKLNVEEGILRENLCYMAEVAGFKRGPWKGNLSPFLHIFFLHFQEELKGIFKMGFPLGFSRESEPLSLPKGKMNPLKKSPPGTIHCTFHRLSLNNPVNRMLKRLSIFFMNMGCSSRELERALRILGDVPVGDEQEVRSFKATGPFLSYRSLVELSKFLILGEEGRFSIMVDMRLAFEKFVLELLKGSIPLEEKPRSLFFYSESSKHYAVPDAVIPGKAVVDVKWKVVVEPPREDLFQVFSYGRIYKAKMGVLIYPWEGKGVEAREYLSPEGFKLNTVFLGFSSSLKEIGKHLVHALVGMIGEI